MCTRLRIWHGSARSALGTPAQPELPANQNIILWLQLRHALVYNRDHLPPVPHALMLPQPALAFPRPPRPRREPSPDATKKAVDYLLAHQGTQTAPGSPRPVPPSPPSQSAASFRPAIQPASPPSRKPSTSSKPRHQPDGGFYTDSHATYNTAITLATLGQLSPAAMRRLQRPDRTGRSSSSNPSNPALTGRPAMTRAKPVDKDHPWFGGWGYGEGTKLKSGRRPDLSNTQFVIEALRESGVPASDPSIQNALVFISRTQATEAEQLPWAKGRTDGGFIYSMGFNKIHNFYGESEGPDTTDRDGNEILTTYGSMTYAGLKSLLFADVKKDDPRVQAALRWITANYTLDVNPGLNNAQGLYYYYTPSPAPNAYGEDTITDVKGVKHEWRQEFEAAMAAHQNADGSFVNPADRWMESNPVLVTSYVVLALQDARGK